MKVWVVTGRTESGDEVGPYVYSHQPTLKVIHHHIREDWPEEYEAFGEDGGISLSQAEATIIA